MDIINSEKSYKNYIREMILSGMSKEDILNSSSDERIIYNSCFPSQLIVL